MSMQSSRWTYSQNEMAFQIVLTMRAVGIASFNLRVFPAEQLWKVVYFSVQLYQIFAEWDCIFWKSALK